MKTVKNFIQVATVIMVMFVKNLLGLYKQAYAKVGVNSFYTYIKAELVGAVSMIACIAVLSAIASVFGYVVPIGMTALFVYLVFFGISLVVNSTVALSLVVVALEEVELGRMIREGIPNVLYGGVQRDETCSNYVDQPLLMAA